MSKNESSSFLYTVTWHKIQLSDFNRTLTPLITTKPLWFNGSQVYKRRRWRGTILTLPIKKVSHWDPNPDQPLRRRPTSFYSGGTGKGCAAWSSKRRTIALTLTIRPVQARVSGPLSGSIVGSSGRISTMVVLRIRVQISWTVVRLTAVVTDIWTSVSGRPLRLIEFWGKRPYFGVRNNFINFG